MVLLHEKLSNRLLGMAFRIHGELGPGLLEAVYEEAFCVELGLEGIPFDRQKRFPVFYRGVSIGEYVADLVVDGKVLLELKAVKRFSEVMKAPVCAFHIHVGADLAPSWCTDDQLPEDLRHSCWVPH